ncbi:hypothetical protein B1F77_11490 [Pseudomonas syringae]|uniref:Uncharacterized protein n=1 Tax=Pseudomonas syringae TaxID=317 RepID=A0AB37ZUS0_PSESX|nr:hypothetical protein ALP82_200255 [Pseudomonas savastanoi pv. fraxini]RXT77305.1 hypothetical protein B1F77_11490 [Pseudomonas syringae]RXT81948.1 hypothetical protein B1F72_25735 [Pseudomonas syringae]SDO19476.1 hypothetical protein SAMN05444505_11721 [Pseudomonas syringae]
MEIITIAANVICYWLGYKTLRILTCNKWDDPRGKKLWVAFIGFAELVIAGFVIIYVGKHI